MISKKEQILKAFEDLDIYSLALLLNENQTYQDVTKEIFLRNLKELFVWIIGHEAIITDFKRYSGVCSKCNEGLGGFSFINSEKVCYGSFIFEEFDDDFKDIYSCTLFSCTLSDIKENYGGISFFDDEKVGFMLNEEELLEKEFCLRGITELKNESNRLGFLSIQFLKDWQHQFNSNYLLRNLFGDTRFSFRSEISQELGTTETAIFMMENNMRAKEYLHSLNFAEFNTAEGQLQWFSSVYEEYPLMKLASYFPIPDDNVYIEFYGLNFRTIDIIDYLKFQNYFVSNMSILPYSMIYGNVKSFTVKGEEEQSDYSDYDDFPF